MPWTTDSNGKSVWEGDYPDATTPLPETATATQAPPRQKPERVTPDKPWWEQLKDAAVDVVEDVAPALRYAPNAVETIQGLTQGKMPGFIDRAVNDAQYELNQLSSPETALPRLTHLAIKNNPATEYLPDDLGNTLSLGGAKATANVAKSVLDGGGGLTPAREGAIDQVLDNYYAATQESKLPSEMSEDELAGDDMRSSLVLNTALAVGGGQVFGAIGKAYPALGRATQFLDPSKGKTFMGMLSRMAAGNLVDEPLSTFLDDNTGGTLLGLFGADADPVKPGMSRTEASQAAFWPNLGSAMLLGGGLAVGARALSRLPNIRRAKTAQTATSQRTTARSETVANGVQQKDEDGKYSFTKETLQPEEAENVEGRVQTDDGEPAVTGDVGPTEVTYDPSIPEVDAAYEAIEGNFSNDQLARMNELQMQGVDTAVAIETVSSPAPAANAVNPAMAYDEVAAPKSKLAQGEGSISDRFGSVSQENLLSLASPQNSPAFSEAISEATGKEWPNFNRFDILSAIERLEADGRTVMPSRLMGQPTMLVEDIEVDPKRFQFKQGVDDQGQQKGNSLDGVEVWNEDMEGIVQVWTDPMDGLTYVVNGHNRLAKADKLRIPSLPVKYINAPTAELARAKGAIANIADDKGTAFDAAKYMRDSGITDLAQLTADGMPLKSGLAVEGMALSKLPDNIFQDAVDGIVSKGKALALGGSGLDETGMQQAYKALQSRDLTDTTFDEVIQQAKFSPTVQGDQVDLFGNTDMLNLMVQKGQLAAAIEKGLRQVKKAATSAAKNVDTLEGAGSQINKAGTKSLADDTEALVNEFKASKYMDTPTSQLLNEGALEIENGAKVKAVADRIRRQLIEAAEKSPAPEKAIDPEAKAEAPEETVEVLPRKAQIKKILATGAKKGELRPSTTPLIETPDPGKVATDGKRADVALLEGLDNEARLGEEWAAIDDAVDADRLEAERKAIGYSEMTFEEKKGAGMLDGLAEAEKPRRRSLADQMRGDLNDLGQSIGKFTRTVDGIMDRQGESLAEQMKAAIAESNELDRQMARKIGQHIDDQAAGLRELSDTMQPPALPAAEFVIPKDLSKSAPRFGRAKLQFESDLDRAAYMIRNKAKKSKGEDRMIAALEEQGYDVDEIRALGDEVKAQIQDGVKEVTGSRRAPQEEFTIQVPKSALASTSSPRLSRTGPQLSRSGEYDEGKFRKRYEGAAERRKFAQEAALLDLGLKLPSTIAGMTRVSEGLGREMVAGLKDAARISGLDPLRIQYLDKVDTRKLFGDADANKALEQWDPNAARFARENPGDPLMDVVDGETSGVFVPRDYPSIHRSMIYLAMGPSLDTRLASKALTNDAGYPFQRTAYHEAFHAVQDWLEKMSVKGGVGSKSVSMMEAMGTEEAIAEMTALVKSDRFGNYQKGMNIKELQAEAFATWYNNRKVRMKAGGVQAAFEKIKKFVNTLRRKWKLAVGKDPSYVDVFELAAEGKIADKGNQAIAKLRPEQLEALKGRIDSNMDAMLPELTDRVHSYLKQKQADFDVLTDKLADELNMEGC